MLPITADAYLARRIETANTRLGTDAAKAMQTIRPDLLAGSLEVAGGCAIYAGSTSPLTHALGLGLSEAAITDAEIERVEDFFRERDAPSTIECCPLAHPSLLEILGRRGYRPVDFENVLVRLLHPWSLLPASHGIPIRQAGPDEAQLWAETVGRGFFELDTITREECEVGLALFHMEGSRGYLAERDGLPLGGAGLALRDSLAFFYADSTLPRARRKGVHEALIQLRLLAAQHAGGTLAVANTQPGSGSQRNFERCGFQVAYTKVICTRTL